MKVTFDVLKDNLIEFAELVLKHRLENEIVDVDDEKDLISMEIVCNRSDAKVLDKLADLAEENEEEEDDDRESDNDEDQ